MTDTIATQSSPRNPSSTTSNPAAPSPQKARPRIEKLLNGALAAMVAVYGILTALTIFSASSAEGLYYDNAFIAQAHLSDASELSLEAQIGAFHDLNVLEQMQVHEMLGSDPAIIEFLHGQLSAEAQASLERSEGVDGIYGEEIFAVHVVERENAMNSFALAGAWSERAGTYEVIATALAVGLAFTAWASLMEQTGWIRWTFTIAAALILVGSLGFLGVHLVTREPLENYITPAEVGSTTGPGSAPVAGHYVHPSGAFEFAVPADWELVNEDATSALFGDGESLVGAEFADVETVYTEDEMQAHAADFVDATLGDYPYQIDVLNSQPEFTYAGVAFEADGSSNYADFFLEQQETVIFVFFFATPSDARDGMLPTRDQILETFEGHPEAVQATSP